MVAPTSRLKQLHRPRRLPAAPSVREAADELGTHRFQVVAANIVDAVTSMVG